MNKLTKRLSELLTKGTPGEWFHNSYSSIHSAKCRICGFEPAKGESACEDHFDTSESTPRIACVEVEYGDTATEQGYADMELIVETINALPKLLEIIRIQGEALSNVEQCPIHSLSSCCCQRVAKQALEEVKRIEDE